MDKKVHFFDIHTLEFNNFMLDVASEAIKSEKILETDGDNKLVSRKFRILECDNDYFNVCIYKPVNCNATLTLDIHTSDGEPVISVLFGRHGGGPIEKFHSIQLELSSILVVRLKRLLGVN